MVFNVEPGATPRGPKHLNRTVGFSILKDVLLFHIFYYKAPALLETLTRLSAYKLSKSCLSLFVNPRKIASKDKEPLKTWYWRIGDILQKPLEQHKANTTEK